MVIFHSYVKLPEGKSNCELFWWFRNHKKLWVLMRLKHQNRGDRQFLSIFHIAMLCMTFIRRLVLKVPQVPAKWDDVPINSDLIPTQRLSL